MAESADMVIIGSGIGGSTLASALADSGARISSPVAPESKAGISRAQSR